LRARLSSANSLQLVRVFPDLAFRLLFHWFKTIFNRMKTVYCRDRNQQMQSKYICLQSQGNAKSCSLTYKINKHTNVGICEAKHETRFPGPGRIPYTTRKIFYSTTSHSHFLSLSHTTWRVTVFLIILFWLCTMFEFFLHSCRQRRWDCNVALGKRAFWLANTLDPFARGLHAYASLFICTFSRQNKTVERQIQKQQQLYCISVMRLVMHGGNFRENFAEIWRQ